MPRKMTKRGRSHYVESWNPAAKNFIWTCKLCGTSGYKPSIEDEGFEEDSVRRAIKAELMRITKPLSLDELGRCPECAAAMDKAEKQ